MPVHNSEHLARFIISEGWYTQGQVKGDAFRPRKDNKVLKASVIRHDGQNPDDVKRSGNVWKAIPRKTQINIFGWADVTAGAVRIVSIIPSLDVEEAGSASLPNHANIIGWNPIEGQFMLQAEEVARQATLNLL